LKVDALAKQCVDSVTGEEQTPELSKGEARVEKSNEAWKCRPLTLSFCFDPTSPFDKTREAKSLSIGYS